MEIELCEYGYCPHRIDPGIQDEYGDRDILFSEEISQSGDEIIVDREPDGEGGE